MFETNIQELYEKKFGLNFPTVPSYFPEESKVNIQTYLDEYKRSAILAGKRNFISGLKRPWDKDLKIPREKYYQNALVNHRIDGWLLPEQDNPTQIGENYFAIGRNINIGTIKIGDCLGGVFINENEKLALGFHIYPLSNFEGDDQAMKIAKNYWVRLKKLMFFQPTRFDFASSEGGLDYDYNEIENTRDHQLLLDAFSDVFGAVPVSKWRSSQILYRASDNKIIHPELGIELEKAGATEKWTSVDIEE